MARTSLKRIRRFIQMYGLQDKVGVASVDDTHVVVNNFGTDNETTYVCRTLTDAADCVNHIIFDIPFQSTPAVHRESFRRGMGYSA